MKICPLGAKLFRADRQTDMTKLIATFLIFAAGAKNSCCLTLMARSNQPTLHAECVILQAA